MAGWGWTPKAAISPSGLRRIRRTRVWRRTSPTATSRSEWTWTRSPRGRRSCDRSTVRWRLPWPSTRRSGLRARWLGLYFPGWRAEIDGVGVPVAPENDTGLITFAVPAGEHLVTVYFGSTPIRDLGAALSLVGVALTLGWTLWGPGRRRHRQVQGAPPAQGPQQTTTGPHGGGGRRALPPMVSSGDRRGFGRCPSHCREYRSFPRAAVAVGEWRAA